MSVKVLLVIALGVIMIVVGTYLFSTYGPHLLAIETGELIPFQVDSQKDFDVQMGGIHAITTATELSSGFNFSQYFYISGFNYPFQISLSSGKLLISAEIRDKDGNVVATITKNQWGVSNNPVATLDKNYNSYAFEVITLGQIPILQVVMTPENRIFVGGVFYSTNSTMIAMLNDTTIINPEESEISNYNQMIFQYPSDSHLGKLVENSPYAFGSALMILAPTEIINIGYVLFGIGTFVTLVVSVNSFKKRNSGKSGRGQKKKTEQKSKKLSLRFYLSEDKKGYNSGKKLDKDQCERIFKRWNKLEKQVLPLLDKEDSEKTKWEKKLESDYTLFWMHEALKKAQETTISEKFADGFKKAILEKCT
ncbi:MAG TPA: hypothetical protein VI864_06685 [Candidatus Bathyarchaeia archaeon]|nr:hypothetical protein [Candidatus Bathyarchaeia archaeon]